MDVEEEIERLEERLRAVATTERAEHEKRYLKSDLAFLGATVWQIERAVKELVAAHRQLGHDDVLALVRGLWAEPIHERRMASVMVLERYADRLSHEDLLLLERLVRESRTWALVDGLSTDVLGRLVQDDPARITPILDR